MVLSVYMPEDSITELELLEITTEEGEVLGTKHPDRRGTQAGD